MACAGYRGHNRRGVRIVCVHRGEKQAKDKECQRVIKLLKNDEYLIGLDLVKKQPTSPEFAKYLEDKFVLGGSSISFVIGGSYGLSDELKSRCNDRIGLSNMTFLHQMTRLILLEQIYRAFKINRNEVYHKWEIILSSNT